MSTERYYPPSDNRIMPSARPSQRTRDAFSLIELIVVMGIMGVVAGMIIPRLNIGRYRIDAAAQQVRSVLQTAQRTSLTRQYDVIVSVDTVKGGLRIAEDINNNGAIEISEWKFWRPSGEGNRFSVPPVGLTGLVTSAVTGGNLKTIDGLPSVSFHRDGSTSSNAEFYVSSEYRGRVDFCAISLTRSTSRTELYRLAGKGVNAKWELANQ